MRWESLRVNWTRTREAELSWTRAGTTRADTTPPATRASIADAETARAATAATIANALQLLIEVARKV
jgi:hypothetical protein